LIHAHAARHIGEALGGATAILFAIFLAWLASSHTWLEVLVIAWSIPPFYVAFTVGGIWGESAYEKLHHKTLQRDDEVMDLEEFHSHRTE
jgi:ABC-type Fe3+ transport system permease subunit